MLGKIEDGRRGQQRRECWMASPTQYMSVWVNSWSWWWTGRPSVLQSMGLQRERYDWATELNWISSILIHWFLRYHCSLLPSAACPHPTSLIQTAMIYVFWTLSFKPTFSLSSFTFIKRLFISSSLSSVRVVSSAYLRLLIFLPAILIPACASSSPAFLMMYSA